MENATQENHGYAIIRTKEIDHLIKIPGTLSLEDKLKVFQAICPDYKFHYLKQITNPHFKDQLGMGD